MFLSSCFNRRDSSGKEITWLVEGEIVNGGRFGGFVSHLMPTYVSITSGLREGRHLTNRN